MHLSPQQHHGGGNSVDLANQSRTQGSGASISQRGEVSEFVPCVSCISHAWALKFNFVFKVGFLISLRDLEFKCGGKF